MVPKRALFTLWAVAGEREKGTNVLNIIRGTLAPLGLVLSAVDRTLATGSFNNAREAVGDSRLRRAAWNEVIVHRDEEREAGSAA